MKPHDSAPHGRGPFLAEQVRSKDRYEIHDGHPVYCAPTGGSGSQRVLTGAEVLSTDPDVDQAGIDTGFAPRRAALYAPDIAIGNVPDSPGWVAGVPPLAVEYAGVGQDEDALATKISDLIDSGTKYIWVIRHDLPNEAPPYVEVYDASLKPRCVELSGTLEAPGILKNPVPVRALLDREAAHEVVLRNLVQRKGYESFEQALRVQLERGIEQGIAKGEQLGIAKGEQLGITRGEQLGIAKGEQLGIAKGKRMGVVTAIESLCEVLDIPLSNERRAQLEASTLAELEARLTELRQHRQWVS